MYTIHVQCTQMHDGTRAHSGGGQFCSLHVVAGVVGQVLIEQLLVAWVQLCLLLNQLLQSPHTGGGWKGRRGGEVNTQGRPVSIAKRFQNAQTQS